MKTTNSILFAFVLVAFSCDAKPEIVFGANNQSKVVEVRELTVPEIYEIRDVELVESKTNITEATQNGIIVKKLQPQEIVTEMLEPETVVAKLDVQDILIPEYLTETSIDLIIRELDTSTPGTKALNVNVIDVIVDGSVYEYLEQMRTITQFDRNYTKYGYETKAYLKDLDALDQWTRYQWVQRLVDNKECNIIRKRSRVQHKILAEAKYVEGYDEELLLKNLKKAKSFGYDAILVRYDGTEDYHKLIGMVDVIKNSGFAIYSVYVGNDNAKWNPFIGIFTFEKFVTGMAEKSDGIFLNWRSTSSHVKLLPAEFFNYICNLARETNPEVLIYGEVFYGKIDYIGQVKVCYTAPKNVTGVVVNNMGYYGYNHAYVMNKLFSKVVKDYNRLEKIGQVIGLKPYYLTKDKVEGMTLATEYKYKKKVERSFAKTDVMTVTFLHDGVDDNHTEKYGTTDNIVIDTRISE